MASHLVPDYMPCATTFYHITCKYLFYLIELGIMFLAIVADDDRIINTWSMKESVFSLEIWEGKVLLLSPGQGACIGGQLYSVCTK